MEFREWLIKEKQYSDKSSRDVQSRLKRAVLLSGEKEITSEILAKLEANTAFKELSLSVKSQIRRAVKLYHEYLSINKRL